MELQHRAPVPLRLQLAVPQMLLSVASTQSTGQQDRRPVGCLNFRAHPGSGMLLTLTVLRPAGAGAVGGGAGAGAGAGASAGAGLGVGPAPLLATGRMQAESGMQSNTCVAEAGCAHGGMSGCGDRGCESSNLMLRRKMHPWRRSAKSFWIWCFGESRRRLPRRLQVSSRMPRSAHQVRRA